MDTGYITSGKQWPYSPNYVAVIILLIWRSAKCKAIYKSSV